MMSKKLFRQDREPVKSRCEAEDKQLYYIDQFSVFFIKIIVVLLVALLLSQFVMQFSAIRYWVTGVDRFEGNPLSYDSFFCISAQSVV